MTGWWTIGRLRGAPVRIHWTTLVGAILFGGLAWAPGFWVAFAIVILVHELGHAAMVRATGHRVSAVEVHAGGGECTWDGDETPTQRALIAWGGVLAQLALAVVAFVVERTVAPSGPFVLQLLRGLTTWNLVMAAFNLLPVRPLDGYEAWPLLPLLWRRRARRRGGFLRSVRTYRIDPRAEPSRRLVPPRAPIDPFDDHAPLSEEARAVVERAAQIARDAAASEREKDREKK